MSWNEPGGDNKDPWSGRGNNKTPPDLDEAIRALQDKLAKLFGGGGDDNNNNGNGGSSNLSPNSMKGVGYLVGGLVLLWGFTGFYTVEEGNNGVETRFGKYTRTTQSGLNWHLPSPIERVDIVNVKQQRFIEVGYRSVSGVEQSSNGNSGSVPKEALMLTEDENIVDVQLTVQYQVENAKDFLFNVANPVATLKQVTESVQRGVIGSYKMDEVLTEKRAEIVTKIEKDIVDVMKPYQAGILITGVNLRDAQAPQQVQHAFDDATKAREDKERLINEANAYKNDVVPKARGAAARKLQEAEGYKQQVIAQAEGEASRFTQLFSEYQKAPDIMRKRLYIETMESVLSETNTVMLNVKDGGNNMLYLPLDKLVPQATAPAASNNSSSTSVVEPAKPSVPEKILGFDRANARELEGRGR